MRTWSPLSLSEERPAAVAFCSDKGQGDNCGHVLTDASLTCLPILAILTHEEAAAAEEEEERSFILQTTSPFISAPLSSLAFLIM